MLTEEVIRSGKYNIGDVVLPLAGTKIQYPENSTGAYYDEVLGEFGVTKEDLKKVSDRDISLPGDYRRLLCIPSDTTFEVKVYEDPLQPLLETDLMKISAKTMHEKASSEAGDAKGDDEKEEEAATSEKANPEKKEESQLIGMVVGFTLPPSSYATIALRELMKKPTSADYQRQLQLSGNCESTLNNGDDNENGTKSPEKKDD